jgi:hypothetical protein
VVAIDVEEVVKDSPTYWFVLLENARSRCDFELAAQARRELSRLGVQVTYRPKAKEALNAK